MADVSNWSKLLFAITIYLLTGIQSLAAITIWEEGVASPGIEPGSGASETLILSIVLRGQGKWLQM